MTIKFEQPFSKNFFCLLTEIQLEKEPRRDRFKDTQHVLGCDDRNPINGQME